ncbi:MAG: DUF3999 domain-containing protein [Candidatus Accumulibacter sp.]|uniref:DUF3999 domain-containing protein n=1 Tax=Accumulibacter sp. TaxID=2053492 RepID=UPI0025E24F13|nr:DUF3999 domain-containing protein [Accumulibacter sp.]MCM8599844.1 DUF3999 domain-containing protein [Accumulibacter sp.]MCM8663801.1 DUF3999 domain-containing protein [Accumulibacter sp.]
MKLLVTWLLYVLGTLAIAETPQDFAFGIPLELAGQQALFQVELPRAAYEGVLRGDLGDLRVFNGERQAVPYAFLPAARPAHERRQPLPLPYFALRGDPVVGIEGLEIRIERAAGRAVLTMNDRGRVPAHAATLLGYLVDASAIAQPLQALLPELSADPEEVMTRVRVDASDDLTHWTRLLSDAPVVRLVAGTHRLEQLRLELPPSRAKYLRLSWPATAQALPLAGLAAEPGDALIDPPRQWKQVAGTTSGDRVGEWAFDLGGQFPVDRLRLLLPQANSVASIEILSRSRATDPWRRVMASTAYRLGPSGQEVVNPDLAIAATSDRYWLLRVDQRGGGLGTGSVQLAAGWLPQRLIFAARGAPPFLLAYGSATAKPAVYPVATLVPGYRGAGDETLANFPIGRASTGSERVLAGERALRTPADWKRWGLWGSLLLAVALLAWMALRLARQLGRNAAPAEEEGKPMA